MAGNKKPNPKALLRTRWRELLADGSMSRLRSEGRLVALYVLSVADWSTCVARFSIRRAAKSIGVYPNTVQRGIGQMVDAGILEVLDKPLVNGKTSFRISGRTPLVCAPTTSGVRERTQGVCAPYTSGVRPVHEPCAPRTRAVCAAHTGGVRGSVLLSGSPVRTSESTSTADAGAGGEPARRRRPSRWIEGMPPPMAAGDENSATDSAAGIDSRATLPGEVNT